MNHFDLRIAEMNTFLTMKMSIFITFHLLETLTNRWFAKEIGLSGELDGT